MRFLIKVVQYSIACAISMYLSLSLATGQFPPPVQESIVALKTLQEASDPKALQMMVQKKKEREMFLDTLSLDGFQVPMESAPVFSPEDLWTDNRSLKYENMLLKSRLDNCTPNEKLQK
jgi:hypothetical protein